MFGIYHRMRFFLCTFTQKGRFLLCTGGGYSRARSLPQWGEVGGGSQPSAGLLKIFIQILHHEVDSSARGPAHEASKGVAAHLKRHRGMMVVVERTQALMPLDSQSEPLRDFLNGKVAKLLQFILFHKKTLPPAPPCEGGE